MTGTVAAQVAFVSGATEGLNLVLRAVLDRGARVLTTRFEHSSVVRPLLALADERNLSLGIVGPEPDGAPASAGVVDRIAAERPAVVVFTHASNVTGGCFDARSICAAARACGAVSVLDASQTAGLLPLDVGADVVVASGHKALGGPPGIGFVAVREGLVLAPQKQGGTGSSRALERHPVEWPGAFEAGTPNTPAIFGLAAALAWVDENGPDVLLAASLRALDRLIQGLQALPAVRFVPVGTIERVPVISFVHEHYDPVELGSVLAGAGIHVRAGFHCAPWLHAEIGTGAAGTVRISTGPMTTDDDCDRLVDVVHSCG
jgi:selenocysteine lyase/cysteine desulfurase